MQRGGDTFLKYKGIARPFGFRIMPSRAALMASEPTMHIVGYTGVEAAITAFQYIDNIHTFDSLGTGVPRDS